MKELLKKFAQQLKAPERSPAWLAGWQDNADHGENRNPHISGTAEHADYEAGFNAFLFWFY